MNVRLLIILFVVIGLISHGSGDDIVKRIKKRYDDVAKKCKDSKKRERPAFECSGIMIRGVNSNAPLAWGLKDLNKKKDGFSLGYLRRDQKFSSFPFTHVSGFIIYPHLKTPRKKNTYKVFCSFPIDGWTDGREGRHGCGKYGGDVKSGHCGKQKIKSYTSWKSHFKEVMTSGNPHFMTRQCGFDMTIKSAAKDFLTSLKANGHIRKNAKQYGLMNNELKMHAWNVDKAKNIPIEAFFYLIGSAQGKQLAKKFQKEFRAKSGGEKVPIVGIRLPTEQKKFKVISG